MVEFSFTHNSNNTNPMTVSDLNYLIKGLIDSEPFLSDINVLGEVSNKRLTPKGHVFFNLRDAEASIPCVKWKSFDESTTDYLSDGKLITCSGKISTYFQTGKVQFYVDRISDSGSGNIQAEFNKLRSKLEREGLFESNRKRSLPRFPSNICLITSREGAVLKDIINVISRRYPVVELHLLHTTVQGTGSAEELCRAVKLANQLDFDIIILARGGGSPEDLTPFNNEKLARLIFSSRIPIISAIGHETDYTISDYVADVRASTPSVAAEIAVPSSEQLFVEINRYRKKLISEITGSISDKTMSYENTNDRLLLGSPQISNYGTSLKNISNKLLETLQTKIRSERHKVEILGKSLNLLDPFVSMSRGFVLTENLSGHIVRSIKDIKKGETMVIRYSDGAAKTKIIETDFPNEK